MGQSFDIRKKQQLNRIANNITDPVILLSKVINAIKVCVFDIPLLYLFMKLNILKCASLFCLLIVSRTAQQEVYYGFGAQAGRGASEKS